MANLIFGPIILHKRGSVDVSTWFLQKVVHHNTVPKFNVIVLKFGVSSKFDPIVFDYIRQSLVTTKSSQSPFSGYVFYVLSNSIV